MLTPDAMAICDEVDQITGGALPDWLHVVFDDLNVKDMHIWAALKFILTEAAYLHAGGELRGADLGTLYECGVALLKLLMIPEDERYGPGEEDP